MTSDDFDIVIEAMLEAPYKKEEVRIFIFFFLIFIHFWHFPTLFSPNFLFFSPFLVVCKLFFPT